MSTTSFSLLDKYSFRTSLSLQMLMVLVTASLVRPYNFTCSSYTFVKVTYWLIISLSLPSYIIFTFTSMAHFSPLKNSSERNTLSSVHPRFNSWEIIRVFWFHYTKNHPIFKDDSPLVYDIPSTHKHLS